MSTAVVALLNSILFFTLTSRANSLLHHQAFTRVLAAPLGFFTANPIGRIVNRFAAGMLRNICRIIKDAY